MLDNSMDAYILALETINRLSVRYRLEASAYLMCNAWELLLKAKIIDDAHSPGAVYYKKERGRPRRSLSLRDSLKSVIPNERDPTRRNLERVADLRDEAVHLVIGHVPAGVLAVLQSCVLNYHKRLNEWFGLRLSDRVPVGMMALVYDLSPQEFDLANPVLRRRLGADAAKYLTQFQADVRQESEQLGQPAEFCISIDYRLALTKKEGEGDITLSKGDSGMATAVVEVPKDPSRTHPYRQTEVVTEVNSALHDGCVINGYDVLSVVQVHHIRKRADFHYKCAVKGSPTQYSRKFVDWLVGEHQRDPDFFRKARDARSRS